MARPMRVSRVPLRRVSAHPSTTRQPISGSRHHVGEHATATVTGWAKQSLTAIRAVTASLCGERALASGCRMVFCIVQYLSQYIAFLSMFGISFNVLYFSQWLAFLILFRISQNACYSSQSLVFLTKFSVSHNV